MQWRSSICKNKIHLLIRCVCVFVCQLWHLNDSQQLLWKSSVPSLLAVWTADTFQDSKNPHLLLVASSTTVMVQGMVFHCLGKISFMVLHTEHLLDIFYSNFKPVWQISSDLLASRRHFSLWPLSANPGCAWDAVASQWISNFLSHVMVKVT